MNFSRGRSNESFSYHLTSHGKTRTFLHQDPFEGEHGGRKKCTIGISKDAWEFH